MIVFIIIIMTVLFAIVLNPQNRNDIEFTIWLLNLKTLYPGYDIQLFTVIDRVQYLQTKTNQFSEFLVILNIKLRFPNANSFDLCWSLSFVLFNAYSRDGEPFQRRVPIFRHLVSQNIWRAKTTKIKSIGLYW